MARWRPAAAGTRIGSCLAFFMSAAATAAAPSASPCGVPVIAEVQLVQPRLGFACGASFTLRASDEAGEGDRLTAVVTLRTDREVARIGSGGAVELATVVTAADAPRGQALFASRHAGMRDATDVAPNVTIALCSGEGAGAANVVAATADEDGGGNSSVSSYSLLLDGASAAAASRGAGVLPASGEPVLLGKVVFTKAPAPADGSLSPRATSGIRSKALLAPSLRLPFTVYACSPLAVTTDPATGALVPATAAPISVGDGLASLPYGDVLRLGSAAPPPPPHCRHLVPMMHVTQEPVGAAFRAIAISTPPAALWHALVVAPDTRLPPADGTPDVAVAVAALRSLRQAAGAATTASTTLASAAARARVSPQQRLRAPPVRINATTVPPQLALAIALTAHPSVALALIAETTLSPGGAAWCSDAPSFAIVAVCAITTLLTAAICYTCTPGGRTGCDATVLTVCCCERRGWRGCARWCDDAIAAAPCCGVDEGSWPGKGGTAASEVGVGGGASGKPRVGVSGRRRRRGSGGAATRCCAAMDAICCECERTAAAAAAIRGWMRRLGCDGIRCCCYLADDGGVDAAARARRRERQGRARSQKPAAPTGGTPPPVSPGGDDAYDSAAAVTRAIDGIADAAATAGGGDANDAIAGTAPTPPRPAHDGGVGDGGDGAPTREDDGVSGDSDEDPVDRDSPEWWSVGSPSPGEAVEPRSIDPAPRASLPAPAAAKPPMASTHATDATATFLEADPPSNTLAEAFLRRRQAQRRRRAGVPDAADGIDATPAGAGTGGAAGMWRRGGGGGAVASGNGWSGRRDAAMRRFQATWHTAGHRRGGEGDGSGSDEELDDDSASLLRGTAAFVSAGDGDGDAGWRRSPPPTPLPESEWLRTAQAAAERGGGVRAGGRRGGTEVAASLRGADRPPSLGTELRPIGSIVVLDGGGGSRGTGAVSAGSAAVHDGAADAASHRSALTAEEMRYIVHSRVAASVGGGGAGVAAALGGGAAAMDASLAHGGDDERLLE